MQTKKYIITGPSELFKEIKALVNKCNKAAIVEDAPKNVTDGYYGYNNENKPILFGYAEYPYAMKRHKGRWYSIDENRRCTFCPSIPYDKYVEEGSWLKFPRNPFKK